MRGYAIEEVRIHRFFETVIGPELQQGRQLKSFAAYVLGLLGESERKSCEPMAARSASGADEADTVLDAKRGQNRLLHFLGKSPWDDEAVRLASAWYAINAFQRYEPVTTWVIDDTGFPKQGRHSPGVQRQYSGTLGKVGNCQIGVSLSVATREEHVPIDFELYLPVSWTSDEERRAEVGIPETVVFKTKIELAIGMIQRAKRHELPGDIVLADGAYGTAREFREAIRAEGMDYGVAVQSTTRVWTLDSNGRRVDDEPIRVDRLAEKLGRKAFRSLTWRDGTKGKMESKFCFRRVKIEQRDGVTTDEREPVWLVMEWPDGEDKKFMLTTLVRRMSKKKIVHILKQRWRTEQAYLEMKDELGLDHFEGRTFRGWHHHVTAVLSCYAFVTAERRQLFPPSAGTARRGPLRCAA
jgi:SRSO17 transposase